MIVDLKKGEDVIISEYCCEEMEIQVDIGNIVSDTINLMVPDYVGDGKRGGLDINYCPFCGEKIEIINPWEIE